MEALKVVLRSLDAAYVIIDAVDECNTRTDLLKILTKLVTDPEFAKIRFLTTSRNYKDIRDTLQPRSVPLSMSNPLVDEDISLYVNQELQRHPKLNRWSSCLKDEMLESLVQSAKGMFRLAACQLYLLQKKRTESDIRRALKELPETLDEIYERILLDIPEDDWPYARKAFLWICANDLLQINGDIPSSHLVTAVFGKNGQQNYNYSFVQEICGCLIETSTYGRYDQRTHFAHYSVKEFFVSIRSQNSSASYFSFSEQEAMYEYLSTAIYELDTLESSIGSPQQHPGAVRDVNDFYQGYWEKSFFQYCREAIRPRGKSQYNFVNDERLWRLCLQMIFHPQCALHHEASVYDTEHLGIALRRIQLEANHRTLFHEQQALVLHSLSPQNWVSFDRLEEIWRKYVLEIDIESVLSTPIQLGTRDDNVCTNFLELYGVSSFAKNSPDDTIIEETVASTFPLDTVLMLSVAAHLHFPNCCDIFDFDREADADCVLHAPLAKGADPNGIMFCMTPLQVAAVRWDYAGTKALLGAGAHPNCVGTPGGKDYPHIDNSHMLSSPLHIIRNSVLDVGLAKMLFRQEDREGFVESRKSDGARIEQLLIQYGAKDFVASDAAAYRYPYRRSRDRYAARW